jgi:hypothetical protein
LVDLETSHLSNVAPKPLLWPRVALDRYDVAAEAPENTR